jgi:hypothetical protein
MTRNAGTFQPGLAKVGGRKKGTLDKKVVAQRRLVAHALKATGLTPEEIEALSPLAVMRLVMEMFRSALQTKSNTCPTPPPISNALT